jgi:hypothetical protein
MKKIVVSVYAVALALTTLSATAASAEQISFPFDFTQLAGAWVDNFSTEAACSMKNPRFRFEFSLDKKHLTIVFDRKTDNSLGANKDRFEASVTAATNQTLVIRYDGETRLNNLGKLIEWELAVVAPGIYRWRATDWKTGQVNTVVGIRCSEQ